jgi:tetrapyrrole methylase family protein/MazG family protein
MNPETPMPHITILGLGPGAFQQLTLEAVEALNAHSDIWLRTRRHPLVKQLPPHLTIHSFDEVYDESEAFATVYQHIAERVMELGKRDEGVLYAVPGHPFVGESTVQQIVELAGAAQIPIRVIEGVSFIEPSLTAIRADALDGVQLTDATTFASRYYPPFDGDRPVLIAQLYNRQVASDTKLLLMELYPDEHPVTLLQGDGATLTLPLHELDQREDFGLRTSLWVPPLPTQGSLPYFQDIVAHLRAPDGCPWDREQDFTTLRNSILEEAYEVVDAIERDDVDALREELGDQLLLVTMYAQMASEDGLFTLHDVINEVSTKLIRRHPHVWKDVEVSGSGEVLANWEAIKVQEKIDKGIAPKDVYDEVPLAFPALMRAEKISKRVRKAGEQLPDPAAAFAAWQADPTNGDALGDLLFALANHANTNHLESENLLRGAIERTVVKMRGNE